MNQQIRTASIEHEEPTASAAKIHIVVEAFQRLPASKEEDE
jgi:hypothetical protein